MVGSGGVGRVVVLGLGFGLGFGVTPPPLPSPEIRGKYATLRYIIVIMQADR